MVVLSSGFTIKTPGIVNHDINRPQRIFSLVKQCVNVDGVCNIGFDRQIASAEFSKLFYNRLKLGPGRRFKFGVWL